MYQRKALSYPIFLIARHLLGVVAILLAIVPSAYAGYYSGPAYSGGQVDPVIPPPPYGPPGNYSLQDDGTYGRTISAGPTVSATGKITVKFTWMPNGGNIAADPPPKSVIIYQKCTAQGSADSFGGPGNPGTATASANNGLGSTPVATKQNYYVVINGSQVKAGESASEISTGEKYEAKTGEPVVFVYCEPKATSTGQLNALASVSYKCSISPVTIDLLGTQADTNGSRHVLIGQGVKAKLSGGTFTNHRWSVPGDCFYGFAMSADQTSGGPVPFPIYFSFLPEPKWYWKTGGDATGNSPPPPLTLSCTANAVVNGVNIGAVSAEKKVSVWNPWHRVSVPATGIPYYDEAKNVISSGNNPAGILFTGRVGTPLRFMQQGAGRFYFVQLIHRIHRLGPVTSGSIDTQGFWLDNEWPYDGYQDASSNLGIKTLRFDDTPESPTLTACLYVNVHDVFKCYLMYEPPQNGVGVLPVPLERLDWAWSANATVNLSMTPKWQPVPPGKVTAGRANFWYPPHPQWSQAWKNDPGEASE